MADGEIQAKAQFTAMTEGTQDDWMAIMRAAGPFNRTLPDRLIEVDVPGNARFEPGTEVGVKFPQPAGVLVQVPR